MKVTRVKIILASIVLFALAIAGGCTSGTGGSSTATPGATGEPDVTVIPVPTGGADATPTQVGIRGQAKVDSVDVSVVGSSPPVKVQVVARGYIQASCAQITDISQMHNGNTITITLNTFQAIGIICSDLEAPYEKTVDLDVAGLKAGNYTVTVDGVSKPFTLTADNP